MIAHITQHQVCLRQSKGRHASKTPKRLRGCDRNQDLKLLTVRAVSKCSFFISKNCFMTALLPKQERRRCQ